MSWLSSRWAPGDCAGLHAVFETRRLDKKAYNCQSKVNASVILAEKRTFEADKQRPGKLGFPGRCAALKEDEQG
jgi:hypothetical protein